jgi:formylglycine-generating enzyme required for sulfatase activity
MPTFKISLFRWPVLCLLVCLAGCSPTPPLPAQTSTAAVSPSAVEVAVVPPAVPQASTPALAAPAQRAEGSPAAVCPEGYVRIAPGTFMMGRPCGSQVFGAPKCDEAEHSVTITRAFCMKATEVTQFEWLVVMGSNPSLNAGCGMDCPVDSVTWHEARAYANALSHREGLPECYTASGLSGLDCEGYRLPTESEWEYAARAGTPGVINGHRNPTHPNPVGQTQPNPWGLYDMFGNVEEWTGDWWAKYPDTVTDPTGPATGDTEFSEFPARVVRGEMPGFGTGSATARGQNREFRRMGDIGFRLVRTVP